MGAWSVGVWDNDDAMDFGSDLAESSGWSAVKEALSYEADEDGGIDAADGSCALAAAEVVAAALGRASADLPEDVAAWVSARRAAPPARLAESAKAAVRAVLDEPGSELRALWEESGPDTYAQWRAMVGDLLARLG